MLVFPSLLSVLPPTFSERRLYFLLSHWTNTSTHPCFIPASMPPQNASQLKTSPVLEQRNFPWFFIFLSPLSSNSRLVTGCKSPECYKEMDLVERSCHPPNLLNPLLPAFFLWCVSLGYSPRSTSRLGSNRHCPLPPSPSPARWCPSDPPSLILKRPILGGAPKHQNFLKSPILFPPRSWTLTLGGPLNGSVRVFPIACSRL